MSFEQFKFDKTMFVGQDISSLSDTPSADGMSAADLKARFDNVPKMMIALGKLNGLIDYLIAGGFISKEEIEVALTGNITSHEHPAANVSFSDGLTFQDKFDSGILTGPQGDDGATGLQGPQGAPGSTGPQGAQGTQGPKGDKGDIGATGLTGLTGNAGLQGPQGIQGIQGIQGEKGIQGIQGIQGEKGPTGSQGIQGLAGAKGDRGLQGIQGPQGLQGLAGANGVSIATETSGAYNFSVEGGVLYVYYAGTVAPDFTIEGGSLFLEL